MPVLLSEKHGAVGLLVLNRPKQMNALSVALMDAFGEAFAAFQRDDSVKAIVVTGAGDRAFCAGLDLKELGDDLKGLVSANEASSKRNLVQAIENSPKPVVAAINGAAITGGFEIALACDVRIASSSACFADTHARVGVMPGWGLSQRLSRIVGISQAKEMSLTGNFVDAATAHAWGLVNRVVAPADLSSAAMQLASSMTELSLEFIRHYKKLIDDGYQMPLNDALKLEHERSMIYNAGLTPNDIAGRRADVTSRGRKLTRS